MPDQTDINAVLGEPIRENAVEESKLKRGLGREFPRHRVAVGVSLYAKRISDCCFFAFPSRVLQSVYSGSAIAPVATVGELRWPAAVKLSACDLLKRYSDSVQRTTMAQFDKLLGICDVVMVDHSGDPGLPYIS
jgi:hypothetical protein